MKKLLIAGLDIGTTSAYALLDINGEIVKIASLRHSSTNKIISEMIKHGKIFLIGTDKMFVPSNIKRIATQIGARIIEPEQDLGHNEKTRLVDEFLKKKEKFIKIKNKHEKDALASAVYSWKKIKSLLKKIDDHLKQVHKERIGKKVKEKVLLEKIPIVRAVEAVS